MTAHRRRGKAHRVHPSGESLAQTRYRYAIRDSAARGSSLHWTHSACRHPPGAKANAGTRALDAGVNSCEIQMIDSRLAAIAALTFMLCGSPLNAQTPFQYRQYALETSVATVVELARPRNTDPTTIHQRPAVIQEVRWRAPYMGLGSGAADPVQEATFAFYNDQLYQILVTYDRGRMAGLTDQDVVETLAATYGVPLLREAPASLPSVRPATIGVGIVTVAQWEDSGSLLTLQRSSYSPQYQLVLISKRLDPLARTAIAEARRLDALDAPQRELDRGADAAAAALAARDKAREVNKAAFRP